MRYINYYDNDTLSIFDKNTNKILANILLDKEDIPKVQKLHLEYKKEKVIVLEKIEINGWLILE